MDRQRLEAAICSYNEQTEKRYMRFQFPEEMKESKLQKFLEKYAPEVKREEVVAVCDSLDKVVLTEEYLYSKKLKEKKVVFKGLRKVAPIQLTYGEADEGVLILYWDGTVIRGGLKELRVLEKLFPFLEDVAEKRPEEVPVCSQEEFRELHRRFGRQLRKELTRAAAECSEKMKFFYLSSHFTREKIEEGIRICGAVIRPEDVLAMSYSTLIKESEVVLLTEYGLFSASGKYRWEIPFEGMEIVESDELLLLYQTGPFRSPWIPEAEEGVRMLLHKAVGIYQGAIGEMSSPAKDFSLNLIDGWKEFTSQRKWGLLEGRKNSIFVSSTFKDMHYERDAIHEQVLPILNQAGSKYGQSLSFCDLRWGVNTGELDSEEGARKVLSVCLEEIERCEPYMLVILGERYGWIPEKELIARTVEEYRRDGMEGLEELEQSVTALEIEFGSLSRADHMDRTLFYFRQIEGTPSAAYLSEDSHHAEKLQKLKERIVKLSGGKVRTYTLKWDEEEGRPTGLDAFAEMVTADVLAMMSVEWEKAEKLTPLEKEISAQWSLARRRALQCSARESLIQSILNLLEEGEGLIALQGVSGSGKSTLMGCLAMVLSLSGADVLPLFCGHTAQSDTAQEIMEIMTEFLAVRLKDTVPLDEEEEDLCNRLNQLAARYQEVGEKQVIFLIDALDLLPPDSLRDELKLLPEKLFGKVRAIVSCTETFPLSSVRCIVALPLLGEAQRQEVIKGILASMHRETEQSVIRAIGQKKASESPLYISLLLQRMLMMNKADFDQIMERGDGMSAITARQLELVEQASDTLPGICRELLDSAAARIGGDLSREVIKYLTVSRHGLRESDLERLLTERGISWSALDFSLLSII